MPDTEPKKLSEALPPKLGRYLKNLLAEGVPDALAGQIVMDAAVRVHAGEIGASI